MEEGEGLCWGWCQSRGLPGPEVGEGIRACRGGTGVGDSRTPGGLPTQLVIKSRDARLIWWVEGGVAVSRPASVLGYSCGAAFTGSYQVSHPPLTLG